MIRRISHSEIDFDKYDSCVKKSAQWIYSAESSFLNTTAKHQWEVLVIGDYEAVMPVPYVKKLGLKIVVHPKLTQQLGIFSLVDSPSINEQFLRFFKENYFLWFYAFNEKNRFESQLEKRKNFVIASDIYDAVRASYSPKRKRKLRLNPGVIEFSEIKKDLDFNVVKDFILIHMQGIKTSKEKKQYLEILQEFYHHNCLVFYGFFFKDELINLIALYQSPISTVLLGTYNNKNLVKLNGASNLIDEAIKDFIEQKDFDFEGGNLPNLEEYFRGFRAEMRTFSVLNRPKLGFWLEKK